MQSYDKSKAKRTTIAYYKWQNEQHGTSWEQKIRDEIDKLMIWVKSIDELLAELEMLGYTVKRGKYISIKASDQKRVVRLQTLGADYTAENLLSRILWKDVGLGTISPCTSSPLHNSYSSVINEGENNDINVYKLSTLLMIINRDNLRSIGEVEGKIDQLKYKLEKARQEENEMETKCNLLKSLAAQAGEYFSLMDKPSLTAGE